MVHWDGADGGDADVFKGALAVRCGDGGGRHINPAIALYCWHPDGIAKAVQLSLPELQAIRPDAVVLHSGSADLVKDMRASVGAVRIALDDRDGYMPIRVWIGLGIDGALTKWRKGELTNEQVIARYVAVAALCQALGIEVLVLNGEGKWALVKGDVRTAADVLALADALGKAICAAAPHVIIGLSSFGRLGYHADVRALIEGLTPHCSVFTGQSYAAAPGEPVKGALPAIIAKDEASQEAAEHQHWLRDDVTTGDDSPDDLDRIPSIQGYKTNCTDMTRVLCKRYHVLVWALPLLEHGGRFDMEGRVAVRAALAMRSAVGAGPSCVKDYQREHGLKVDDVPGVVTRNHAFALPSQ